MKANYYLTLGLVGGVFGIGMTVFGQNTNTFVFTNKYKVVIQAEVRRIDSDGIIYSLLDGSGGGKVSFTDLPTDLQLRFGYDAEKVRIINEERAKAVAAQRAAWLAQQAQRDKERQARELASLPDSISSHRFYIRPIDEFDFAKTESGQKSCKEIVAELKGVKKALELGLSYNKFSDLVTEKAIAIEKIKDLRGEDVPRLFLSRVDDCLDAYKESRDWWQKKIDADYAGTRNLREYFMREYWAKASIYLTYCIGIADKNTNVNELVIGQVAEMIKTEQDAVKDGTLDAKSYLDPRVSDLTVEQISEQIQQALTKTKVLKK